ncbi:MAG: 3'(2'),5'-bisphosphate nucleotidase CysQ family protein, partial [Polyangiaceae bacterium]
LCDRLARVLPGAVPIVAEESDPSTYAGFERADAAWFVDPLDGTREFVTHNGEFAVMVGLAEQGQPVIGVIVAPAWRRAFVGVVGEGAFEVAEDGTRKSIAVSTRESLREAALVVSRSRAPERLAAFVTKTGARPPATHGSAGLKAVLVATGASDVYIQPGPAGMRWDACAGEALVVAAGGRFSDLGGTCIDYQSADLVNTRGLLATNGRLHPVTVAALCA